MRSGKPVFQAAASSNGSVVNDFLTLSSFIFHFCLDKFLSRCHSNIQGLLNSHIINICNINISCLTNKINHVYNLLYNNSIHTHGVTETWITPDISEDSLIKIQDYEIARSDSHDSHMLLMEPDEIKHFGTNI